MAMSFMVLLLLAGAVVVGVVLIVAVVFLWPREGKFAIKLAPVNCPRCGELQTPMRKPKNQRQALWGGFTCEKCGCEMDKHGIEVQDGAK